MGSFLEREKVRYTDFKRASNDFSAPAKMDGYYKTKDRPFCLPMEYAQENLFPGIQQSARDFFAKHKIKWHDGQNGKPSNHLCDSQVCCVNFLFPFGDQPDALATLLRPLFPNLEVMEVIEGGRYVSFEWIGEKNYLGEISRGGTRSRGANCTSADAAVMFRRTDRKRQIVLIEWKYTETYHSTNYQVAKSGTSRVRIYQHLHDMADCPLDKSRLPSFGSLFYEPFYQFMRQQFLAHRMESARELGADVVSLLHIAPAHNRDFRRVTSPDLLELGSTATDVWKLLVCAPERFQSVTTEDLFGTLTAGKVPTMTAWLDYIQARYPWAWQPNPTN